MWGRSGPTSKGRTLKTKDTIVAIPADTHCGSHFGLIRPGQWQLENGGYYMPNGVQDVIWRQWEEAWEIVGATRRRRRLIIIHNGDAIEGFHHNATELISIRHDEHERVHIDCMDWALKKAKFGKGDLLYYTQGTHSHAGKSEERIARDLGAKAYREGTPDHDGHDGRFVWPQLHLDVNGVRLWVSHKIAHGGRRIWTEGNSLNYTAKDIYFRCLDNSETVPRFVIGSHFHKWVSPGRYIGNHGTVEVINTPAFKMKDEWAATEGAVTEFTHIGLLYLTILADGRAWWDVERITLGPERVERV